MKDLKEVVGKMASTFKSTKTEPGAKMGENVRSSEELHQTIAVVAYYLAEGRHFEPGHDMEDWLAAEAQVLAEQEAYKGLPA